MSDDGQDELGKRFEDRVSPDSSSASESATTQATEEQETTSSSRDLSNPNETRNTSESTDSGNSDNPSNTGSSPGPDPDPDASRNRERVYMAVGEDRANELNEMYEQFDARSKLAGQGGIEKHRDFWTAAAELVVDHEDELADRLDIPSVNTSE